MGGEGLTTAVHVFEKLTHLTQSLRRPPSAGRGSSTASFLRPRPQGQQIRRGADIWNMANFDEKSGVVPSSTPWVSGSICGPILYHHRPPHLS